ncbi:hypothetical protein F4X10_14955 [Candidatus Poribacteria bacterium]|nr:hypothetical protein [Candidatus Poribacteria bacterium]
MKYIKLLSLVWIIVCLSYAESQEICDIPPLDPPVVERIQNRTYPSIALPGSSLVAENPLRWFPWDDLEVFYETYAKHDIAYYAFLYGLQSNIRPPKPNYGLATSLAGNLESATHMRQEFLQRNPNFIVIPEIRLHNHFSTEAFPSDSEFWLRNTDGQVHKHDVPWDEFSLNILNPKVQQLLIERVVGLAKCGLYDGVLFDAFYAYHVHQYEPHGIATEQEVIEVYRTILKGIRERVRDDFLILVNRNMNKTPRFAEWINGSFMETGRGDPGYTYAELIEIEDALLWNEKNLREPRINILQGYGVFESFDSPNNLRLMRIFTTMSLTHSDGYSIFRVPREIDGYIQHTHIWYQFWDAPLGRPIGEKGQLYDNREGVFIREFTNGWAVYNRSGKKQEIDLPENATGWQSGQRNITHVVDDLDGEIYLKSVVPAEDVNSDGIVNILDLVRVANGMGGVHPDVNGDGIVNILDLVRVANAF